MEGQHLLIYSLFHNLPTHQDTLHIFFLFQAIRDKNLRNKKFKTSLENRLKKMEEVVTETATIEINEKIVSKEIFEEVKINNTNGINQLKEDELGLEKNSIENGHDEKVTSPHEENRKSPSLKEIRNDKIVEDIKVIDEVKTETETTQTFNKIGTMQDNIESHSETDELNKVCSESLPTSDTNFSTSRIVVTTSTPGQTDDEEEEEIIESKPECELSTSKNKSDSMNKRKKH